MWKLHGHLIRKKNGCRQLVAALRDNSIDQSELADLLDPPQSAEPRSLEPLPGIEGHSCKFDTLTSLSDGAKDSAAKFTSLMRGRN